MTDTPSPISLTYTKLIPQILAKRGNYQLLAGPFLETRGRYPGVELSTHESLDNKPVDLITC